MNAHDIAAELTRVAEQLHLAANPTETAGEAVDYARRQLGADHAGITLIKGGGRLETVAPTDAVVEQADHFQYELHEGPCHDSAWQGRTLVAPDLAAEPRWPAWAPKAVELGLGSALGVELLNKSADRRLGSVNLYWERPRTFGDEEVELAHLLSRHAAMALVASLNAQGLRLAMEGRKRIGQAQGILMERYGVDEDRAFAILKRYSQDHNIKLRDLATELATTLQLPEQPTSGPLRPPPS